MTFAHFFLQVLELQNTLDDLTTRVDAVKEENLKLRSENSVLSQYIENLMQASVVFQVSKFFHECSQYFSTQVRADVSVISVKRLKKTGQLNMYMLFDFACATESK